MEFALAAPVLVALLAGAVNYGVGLRLQMEVGEAARAGAAYASAHGYDSAAITSAAQNATALATNVTVTVTTTQPNPSCIDSSGTITKATGATCLNGGAPGTYVTVVTSMTYTFIISPSGTSPSSSLSGKSVARIQ